MQETRVRFLGWEDRLEESMATHSSVLAWRIPRIEALGGLQSMGPHTLIHSFIHSFSTFVEDLLYGKPCSSHWEYSLEQNRQKSLSPGADTLEGNREEIKK